jgi:tRNA threonylcarbamoyl adenosine modification protein YeaZ
MKVLSIDSSSPVASVALLEFGGGEPAILFRADTHHARSDSSVLFEGLESAVRTGGKPDALCVGLGPGSYNGLRAGIAAARAFATALAIPLHAIPSALGMGGTEPAFWAAGDARGGHYWIALVEGGKFLEEPHLLSPGDAAVRVALRPDLPVLLSAPLAGFGDTHLSFPDATRLAMLAIKGDPTYLSPLTPEPFYLKPPHITTPRTPVPSR